MNVEPANMRKLIERKLILLCFFCIYVYNYQNVLGLKLSASINQNIVEKSQLNKLGIPAQPEMEQPEDDEEDEIEYEPPLFVIGGTQKSGTTVLAGYLSHHPNIAFAAKKELHFFDKQSNFQKGLGHYFSEFNLTDDTLVMGEATPFYLASRKACKRIGLAFPDVKMVVLLREPISRAYSEYQMKVRRVNDQKSFISLVERYKVDVLNCLYKHPAKYKLIEKCLPTALSKHGRYNKFSKALRKSYEQLKKWDPVIEQCFAKPIVPDPICLRFTPEIDASSFSSLVSIPSHFITKDFCYKNESRPDPSSLRFTVKSCWKYYKEGYEYVKTIENAFITEIEDFKNCSYPILFKDGKLPTSVKSLLKLLDQSISECLDVAGGITKQYFYRSLYVAQFYHCFKYIPPEQFLILGNRELKENLTQTVEKVCNFLEIPFEPMKSILKQEKVESLISAKFPSFEKITSWKIKSEYDEIPPKIEKYLQMFFHDYNELLFYYLDQDFTDLW